MEVKQTKRSIRSAETKKRIETEGLKLIRRYGYSGTSIQDICKAAGVSIGTFYHFFSSKSELVSYIYRPFENSFGRNAKTYDYEKDDARQLLTDYIDLFLKYMDEETIDFYYEVAFSPEGGNKTFFDINRPNVKFFVENCQGFQQTGKISSETSAEEIFRELVCCEVGVLYTCVTLEIKDQYEGMLRKLLTRQFETYLTKAPKKNRRSSSRVRK